MKTIKTYQINYNNTFATFTSRKKAKIFFNEINLHFADVIAYQHSKLENNTCFFTKQIKFR